MEEKAEEFHLVRHRNGHGQQLSLLRVLWGCQALGALEYRPLMVVC